MPDPTSVALLIGLGTLLCERCFAWLNKIKKAKCCGSEITFSGESSANLRPPNNNNEESKEPDK
jgi:hypothetical protein